MCLQIRKKGSISIRSRCPLPRVSFLEIISILNHIHSLHKSVGNFEPLKTLKNHFAVQEEEEFSAVQAKKYFLDINKRKSRAQIT